MSPYFAGLAPMYVGNADEEHRVTRVLKLAKSSEKASAGQGQGNRNSLLMRTPSTSTSTKSYKSTESLQLSLLDADDIPVVSASYAASNAPSFPLSSSAKANKKLSSAQSELQACEAHLAEKERLLTVKREAVITEGLALRCQSLVECGRTWIEAGQEVDFFGMGKPDIHRRMSIPVQGVIYISLSCDTQTNRTNRPITIRTWSFGHEPQPGA